MSALPTPDRRGTDTLPAFHASWICRTRAQRERFLDLHARLQPLNRRVLLLLVVLVAPLTGTLDQPLSALPAAAAIVVFGLAQPLARRFARPEVWVFGALLLSELAIAAAALLSGLQPDPALALLCWPVAGVCGRFRSLPALVGTAFAVAVVVACSLLADAAAVLDEPLRMTLLVGAVVAVASTVIALRDSDVEHRSAAVVDGLTGVLNRVALLRQVADLEGQPPASRPAVSVAVIDVDFFKLVNDQHGHAVGDEVLRDLGGVLLENLRPYDAAYRLGGEEFVLMMPGTSLEDAVDRADRLRAAIDAHDFTVPITVSIGVAFSAASLPFSWEVSYQEADAHLYAAKRAGRNRVHPRG